MQNQCLGCGYATNAERMPWFQCRPAHGYVHGVTHGVAEIVVWLSSGKLLSSALLGIFMEAPFLFADQREVRRPLCMTTSALSCEKAHGLNQAEPSSTSLRVRLG